MINCKFREIERRLEKRIRMGDYALTKFPSERSLAAEENVTQVTARKAIKSLEKRGLLKRNKDGTVETLYTIGRQEDVGGFVALLAPAFQSQNTFYWQKILALAAQEIGWNSRLVLYAHWNDPVIMECLSGFNGVFVIPVSEAMPEKTRQMLIDSPTPIVSVAADMSSYGILSTYLHQKGSVQRLVEHLASLGHRRIDMLNAQPCSEANRQEIVDWRLECGKRGITGELTDDPVESYGNVMEKSAEIVRAKIRSGGMKTGALICTTEAAAMGACREMTSAGIKVGRDISLCAVYDEGMCRFYCPSITAIEKIDHTADARACLEWMKNGGGDWKDVLPAKPDCGELFAGESTGPAE